MTRLHGVFFSRPVPIYGTHRTESRFTEAGGWSVDRDDGGDFHLVRGEDDFWTDGVVSWRPVAVVDAPPVAVVAEPLPPVLMPPAKGKRGRR